MAVAWDVATNGSGNGAGSYTLTSFNIAANSVVYVETHTSGSSQTAVPTATGLTFVEIGTGIDTTNGKAHLYRAQTTSALSGCVITITTTGFPQSTATALTCTGADMTGTNGSAATGASNTFNSGGSSAPSAAVTTTAAGSLIISLGGETGSVSWTAGSNQTVRTSNAGPGFSSSAAETQNSTTANSGTSVTGNFSLSGSGAVGMYTVEVLAAATPASFPQTIRVIRQAIKRSAYFMVSQLPKPRWA